MGKPVVHFEVVGHDGPKLIDFYSTLFDWKIDANNPMGYGMVETGAGTGIAGGVGPSPSGPFLTFYVQMDSKEEMQAHLDKAVELGGKITMPIMEIPGAVTIAQVADPEGNVVGLVTGGPEG